MMKINSGEVQKRLYLLEQTATPSDNDLEEALEYGASMVRLYKMITLFYSIIILQIQKGIDDARADDTKSLKVVILQLIRPVNGNLEPYLHPNSREGRGFFHPVTGEYLTPAGLNWSDPK
jgi:hypothetical protein